MDTSLDPFVDVSAEPLLPPKAEGDGSKAGEPGGAGASADGTTEAPKEEAPPPTPPTKEEMMDID